MIRQVPVSQSRKTCETGEKSTRIVRFAARMGDGRTMKRFTFTVATDGNTDIVNLSPELAKQISGVKGHGLLHVFVGGSTAAITTVEFEPGLIKHDLPEFFQRLVPDDIHSDHEATWNDDNGHSHVRSALLGPGLMIPIGDGKLMTGEWQQVVLMDFDTRPRRRTIVCTLIT
jgi:secondary thiamine-phosphate synthase enzyme